MYVHELSFSCFYFYCQRGGGGGGDGKPIIVEENYFDPSSNDVIISKLTFVNKSKGKITGI